LIRVVLVQHGKETKRKRGIIHVYLVPDSKGEKLMAQACVRPLMCVQTNRGVCQSD
jgi:hypothetical protein